MIARSLAHPVRKRVGKESRRELWRTVLRESEARYRHELLDVEERGELWDRICKLRRQLGLA